MSWRFIVQEEGGSVDEEQGRFYGCLEPPKVRKSCVTRNVPEAYRLVCLAPLSTKILYGLSLCQSTFPTEFIKVPLDSYLVIPPLLSSFVFLWL